MASTAGYNPRLHDVGSVTPTVYRPRDEQDPPTGPGGRNPYADFRGQRRKRETHVSRTDPEAQLYRKGAGQTAKLCYMQHVLTENRNGLIVGAALTAADGPRLGSSVDRLCPSSAVGAGRRGQETVPMEFRRICRARADEIPRECRQ